MRGSRRLVGKNSGPLYLPFPSFPLSVLLSLSLSLASNSFPRLAALRFSPPTLAVLLLLQSIFFSVSLILPPLFLTFPIFSIPAASLARKRKIHSS